MTGCNSHFASNQSISQTFSVFKVNDRIYGSIETRYILLLLLLLLLLLYFTMLEAAQNTQNKGTEEHAHCIILLF